MNGIITFDWTTGNYTKHSEKFRGSRWYAACAMLDIGNGEKVAAVASGLNVGMEIWNPADGSVKTLTSLMSSS